MGLAFLLKLPWQIDEVGLLEERIFRVSKRARGNTIRCNPTLWTEELIAQTYQTLIEGKGLLECDSDYRQVVEDCFKKETWKRKNGSKVEDCIDQTKLGPILAFLIPILNPEKQTRVSLALATTIYVSLEQKEKIN